MHLFGLLLALVGSIQNSGPKCSDVTFSVTPDIPGGPFKLRGRFCEPEVYVPSNRDRLQVLVHGITFDRNYWSALGLPGYEPANYSWIDYASKQGYPTLSVDRLGNGLSDHPNRTFAVTLPNHVKTLHDLITQIRNNGSLGQSFSEIMYVGHSYGSLVGNLLSQEHPTDIDRLILTGFSKQTLFSISGKAFRTALLPASFQDTDRFGQLSLSYFSSNSRPGRQHLCFAGASSYSPEIMDRDFEQRGTVTLGEMVTGISAPYPAPAYRGKVFVLTGDEDTIFCSSLLGFGKADCGTSESGLVYDTRELYPSAASYDVFVPANTGHCLNLHYTARESFKVVHDWLNSGGH